MPASSLLCAPDGWLDVLTETLEQERAGADRQHALSA